METLLNDLKYLAGFYGWDDADKREVWAITKSCREAQSWWKRLAFAHRMGYRQTAENGFMRLLAWERVQYG